MNINTNKPHLLGGKKTIKQKLPYRRLYWKDEYKNVKKVFLSAWKKKIDFGFHAEFEKRYINNFLRFQGKGFADAVNSESSALWVATSSLKYKNNKKIAAISPVTNPGGVMPLLLKGFKLIVIDSKPNSFQICPKKFKRMASKYPISLLVINHIGGLPVDIAEIKKICKSKKISLIEDCSQAHGAKIQNKKIGNFGDFSIFSTMYRKNIGTGSCGGIIFTKKKSLYNEAMSHADRGKPFENSNYDPKDVKSFKYPALNLNLDEISCSIGISTLKKLPKLISRRLEIALFLKNKLNKNSKVFKILNLEKNITPSIYFITIFIDLKKIRVKKNLFLNSLQSEGVELNPNYQEVVCTWPWIKKYLFKDFISSNAINYRNNSFNLFLNEKYKKSDVSQIYKSLLKIENYYIK